MTRIVVIIETGGELGCGVIIIDGLAVVAVMLFVTLTKLLENPREGVLLYTVVMIAVITGEDEMIGGGIGITEVEVVLITSLLLVDDNVVIVTRGIVNGVVYIIDTIEELGCGVEILLVKVETSDVLVKKTVVGMMLFVTLTMLLENPREGVLLYTVVMIVVTLGMPIEVP